jgi:hypothetical protein
MVRLRKSMVASEPKITASHLTSRRPLFFNHLHLKNVAAVNAAANTSIQNPARKNSSIAVDRHSERFSSSTHTFPAVTLATRVGFEVVLVTLAITELASCTTDNTFTCAESIASPPLLPSCVKRSLRFIRSENYQSVSDRYL